MDIGEVRWRSGHGVRLLQLSSTASSRSRGGRGKEKSGVGEKIGRSRGCNWTRNLSRET